jgi:RNA polymerase sigma factor FliA
MNAGLTNNESTEKNARDRLIREHVPMARRIAKKLGRRTDPMVREDLESSAMIGLVEAAQRYDFTRQEPFPAFACRRIRGAVLDAMRRSDFLPRRMRKMANTTQRAMAELEQRLGRTPEDREMAAKLEIPVERYRSEIQVLSQVCFVELMPDFSDRNASPEAETLEHLERRRMIARVRAGLEQLVERDRQILNMYYVDELTYLEIGKILGVSEARICQLHGRAIKRLKELL